MVDFKGTTKECLFDFFNRLKHLSEDEQNKIAADFVAFLQIGGESVEDWVREKNFPIGFNLLRVRYYLEDMGYSITELENLPDSIRELNRLIATRKIDPRVAVKQMSFPDSGEMLRVLLGKRVTENKTKIITEFISRLKESTETKKGSDEKIKHEELLNESCTSILTDALRALYSIERIATPQAKKLLQANNPQTRVMFRQQFETDFLFSLSNKIHALNELLNALCSEKSRDAKIDQIINL
ncbi:MAG: hypothetical protein M1320_00325 [Patescibacteria group bacterium]|nr:hypothetical protein [Patescibacteria group bacterium]